MTQKEKFRQCLLKTIKENSTFFFSYLHPIGGGSKSLTLPNTSQSFVWTAQEVAKAGGKGAIYILASNEFELKDDDEVVSSDNDVDSFRSESDIGSSTSHTIENEFSFSR